MKAIVLAAVAAGVTACASTQAVLDKPVTSTFHSTKSAADVAFCLANKNNVAALDKGDGSKVVLIKNGYGGVSMAFTIWPEGTGSKIDYRLQFGTVGSAWKQCVGA
jgi:hypothetical protein